MENLNIKEQAGKITDKVNSSLEEWADTASTSVYAASTEKGLLDSIQEKMVSRKLLVFITSTVLMWYGLDSETWGMIAMTYICGQSAIDFAKMWRHG